MLNYFKPAVLLLLLLTLLTGIIYPLVVTAFAQLFYADKANGSLIVDIKGQAVGSTLIGQSFTQAKYFWGRASATSPYPYNASASSGSNLGPTNPDLITTVNTRVKTLQVAESSNKIAVPVDLVTASGSGLDPHISLAAVDYQIKRVAKARNMDENKLHELVNAHTETRQWFVFGEPRINVLQLNLALDQATR
ncbi:MAG: potassium-transporting ATPase subunit KdpC [Methylococcales bacterium]|nr:potassium-transporting ATPase subunit KdpC [Methylococcales bacterium]